MKLYRLLALVLVIVLMATPLAAFAQGDDELELEEYVSEDELFMVMYPAMWSVGTDEDIPFPAVMFGNSESTLDMLMGEEDVMLAEGEAGLMVMLLPADLMAFMGVMVDPEGDITELATAVVEAFLLQEGEDPEMAETEIGEAEEIELDEELVVGYVPVVDVDGEGAFVVFLLGDDLIALAYAITPIGEYTEDLDMYLGAVAASISYEGTGADLMMAMMAPPSTDEDMSGPDGAALVEERCTVCHTADRIETAEKDADGWAETVDRMIGYGAELDEAEREAVLDYLTSME